MPDVMGLARSHGASGLGLDRLGPSLFGIAGAGALGGAGGLVRLAWRWMGRGLLLRDPAHGGGREVDGGAGEHLGDADLAHGGERGAERAHELADEVGEAIDGNGGLHERVGPVLVEPPHPRRDGGWRDEEAARRLGGGPAAGGAQGEDGEALVRRIVRPLSRRDAHEAGIFDAQLLAERGDLALQALALGRQPHARERAVGAPSSHVREAEVREGDGVKQRGAGMLGPPGG